MKLSTSHHFTIPGRRGIQKFGRILLDALQKNHGVKLVSETDKSDIHLNIISGKTKKGSKNILRIDGVYYDIARKGMNGPIRSSIKNSDGVIFQSKWGERFATKMLKVTPKLSTVVFNGVKQKDFKKSSSTKDFEKAFVCCAHWRVNKRLKSIVNCVLEIGKSTGIDLGLYVIGKPDYECKSKQIRYVGNVENVSLFYSKSDYMCHICHLDACPNSVVEGLSSGIPVVCNNIGGTPEIVRDNGIVVDLDSQFDFKYIDRMKDVGPSSVDNNKLMDGMKKMMDQEWSVNRPDLDISVSAKGYYDFFLSVLG